MLLPLFLSLCVCLCLRVPHTTISKLRSTKCLYKWHLFPTSLLARIIFRYVTTGLILCTPLYATKQLQQHHIHHHHQHWKRGRVLSTRTSKALKVNYKKVEALTRCELSITVRKSINSDNLAVLLSKRRRRLVLRLRGGCLIGEKDTNTAVVLLLLLL